MNKPEAPHRTDSGGHPRRAWRDPKRHAWINSLLVPLLPLIGAALAHATGGTGFWWIGPVFVLVLVPIVDRAMGLDLANVPDSAEIDLEADPWYRWCTYLFVPLHLAVLAWACHVWTTGGLSGVTAVGLACTMGVVAGLGINTAHELGHKHPAVERWLAKIALAPTGYGHFFVEHNRGHHARVSTPEDPASSRLGETFWEFLPRTITGSFRSAIEIEQQRSVRLGRPFWSPANDLLQAWALSIVLWVALVAVFGVGIVPMLAIQAVIGFSLLEVVNYIEHYGLLRQKRADGRYERCRPEHSWNAANRASNLVLFNLQRHSDHHAYPTRRYQVLRHFDEVPQLPTGYAGMISVALVPAWWRRVMDHRVLAFYDGDVTRANLHPRTRGRLLARYGAGA